MAQISAWKKIVDENPSYDYKYHNKAGFIHYSFNDTIVHLDDFDVVYGSYSSKIDNPPELKSPEKEIKKLKDGPKSYKKRVDHEKNKLKNIFYCLFERYKMASYTPDKKLMNEVIYQTYINFNRKISRILEESGFSCKHRQKIVVEIVESVIIQCKNAPKQWANFGQGLKKNLSSR